MISNDDINYLIRRYRAMAKVFREDGKKCRFWGHTNIAKAESFELVVDDLEKMLEKTKSLNQRRKEKGFKDILWPN